MPDLGSGDSVEVEGSTGKTYVLKRVGDVYSCSCPAWRNGKEPEKKRTCKHLKAYRGEFAERARMKVAPRSPLFRGEPLEDIFRADLLDQAERLLEQGEASKANELVTQAHRMKKRGESISLYANSEQMQWIQTHVTRCWKVRADVLEALAEKEPALKPLADGLRHSAEKLQKFTEEPTQKKERPKLRLVKPDDNET